MNDGPVDSDRLFDELTAIVEGEVFCDELTRSLYSSGASIFRVKPRCVVQPRNRSDVVKVVEYAAEKGVPITARGGGTSRAGNEVGSGILLDFTKYLNRVTGFDREGEWVRVEPGIILASLNQFLKPYGRCFPIDPSTKDWCTIGGMIANNSSGSHAVKYGTTRDYVASVELVLSNGEVVTTGPISLARSGTVPLPVPETREEEIYRGTQGVLQRYEEPLREERPFTSKNSSGYHLWDLQRKGSLDLTPLVVGSEGTLGVITEATLRVVPLPGKALSGFVYFEDLGHVGEATQRILELGPSMLEIMERHILDLAREQKVEMRPYLPEGTEATLFIEFQEDTEDTLREKFEQVRHRVVGDAGLAVDLKVAKDAAEMALFTKVRSISGPILNRMKGPKRPVAFIEDAAVHPSRLGQYIAGLRGLLEKFGVEAAIYGHAGDGNLHTMAFLDLRDEEDVEKMLALTAACYDLVLELKGTTSGEHGDGRLRTYYVPRQYPKLYEAMVEIKNLFDPEGILNPGCIIADGENSLGRDLKYGPGHRTVDTQSRFDDDSLRAQIELCSGCGKCRAYCSIAHESLEEWSMGRGKATLLREILSGALNARLLDTSRFKEIMDSCINCKRCLTDCPSGVDIPWLAVAGRSGYVEKHGESLGDRLLSDTRRLCEAASSLAPVANLANSLAPVRWGLERAAGLDRRRRLPEFRRRTLRKMLQGRTRPGGDREIVYFLSCYSNYTDPEGEGLSTIEVLEHNGHRVLIPEFRCCGIARISAGAASQVEDDVRANVGKMAVFAEQGIPIVFSEPSCALAVKTEYPRILGSEEAGQISEHCHEIHQYLMKLHRQGELRLDFGEMDLSVGYHNPCHLRSLGVVQEPVQLMSLIPGVRVIPFSDECCGMGGTYGLKSKNFDLSMQIGKRLFAEITTAEVDRVSTGCGACGMQIYQGTGRESVHPIALLAEAYRTAAERTTRRAAAG